MKAYKVFNPDWTCNGFQYEVGKTYTHEGEIELCESGFHACKKLVDCFNYYSFDPHNKVAEVELLGAIKGEDNNKQVTDKIKIVKELTWHDVLTMVNTGDGNSGYRNSGDMNSGYRNSGDGNSGDSNSGDGNSGDSNSGNWNSGDGNSGDSNSGNWNSGDGNSGDSNSGNWNSGDRNSGNWNSGGWNSGNRNSGYFNSTTPDVIMVFNKPCKRETWGNAQKPSFIYFDLTEWINWRDMTDDERKANPGADTMGGYLKALDYKEAWRKAYDNASREDIALLKALPNFDAKVFEEITGINVNQ